MRLVPGSYRGFTSCLLGLVGLHCTLLAPDSDGIVGQGKNGGAGTGGISSDAGGDAAAAAGGFDSSLGGGAGLGGGTGGSAGAGGDASDAGDASSVGIPVSGLVLHLEADSTISSPVSLWADLSPAGHDAVQSNANRQPQLTSVGLSHPVVDLDGVDDYLLLSTGFGDFSKGLSAFILAQMNDVAHYHLLDLNVKGSSGTLRFGTIEPGELQYRAGGIKFISGPSAFAATAPFLFSIVHEPTGDAEMRVNGSFEKSTKMPLPSNGVHDENYIGFHDVSDSAPSADGWYGAIIMYNRAVTTQERAQIESYLAKKWGCCGN